MELLHREKVAQDQLASRMQEDGNVVENLRALLYEDKSWPLQLLSTGVARHCSACGLDGKQAGGILDRKFGNAVAPVQPLILAMAQGDAFGAFQAMISATDDCNGAERCPKCKQATLDDRRANITSKRMPPMVAFEIPDRRAQRAALDSAALDSAALHSLRHGAVVRGDEERELEVKLLKGGTMCARYKLLAVALYNGRHYVVELRDGDAWLRVDGMENGGCGYECSTPDYGKRSCDWSPVCAVYERCGGAQPS